jgi:hypothetical protein
MCLSGAALDLGTALRLLGIYGCYISCAAVCTRFVSLCGFDLFSFALYSSQLLASYGSCCALCGLLVCFRFRPVFPSSAPCAARVG